MDYKKNRNELIHPWERPMRVINIILFFVTIIAAFGFIAYQLSTIETLENIVDDENMQAAFMVFGLLAMIIVQMGRQFGKSRANSVQLTDNQFSEILEIVKDFSAKLEMGYVPEVYLTQQGGVLNAFATSFLNKKFISINADIFELAYLEHKDIDTLAFVIAHELTHLKRKHSTTMMVMIEIYASLIPVWGPAYSRVREYTCDRHAVWLSPEGKEGLILLATGKHLYKNVNMEDYLKTSSQYKGFFLWLNNLLASHPIAPKRMQAIMNTEKWGKVF